MRGPMFLGQPSPALRTMQYLSPEELREHLSRLKVEKARIAARLAARQKAGVTSRHDKAAGRLERRLDALIEKGRRFWTAQGGSDPGENSPPASFQDGYHGGNQAPAPGPQKRTLSSRYLGGRF